MIKRRNTYQVQIGDLSVGSDNEITIQSMTNTSTGDIDKSVDSDFA